MILSQKETSVLKLGSYVIVAVTFSLAIGLPFVVKYVGTYSAPTAAYATRIIDSGGLPRYPVFESQMYWRPATNVEVDFPGAAVLLSAFMEITGLPKEYTMFIPLTGVASLIYFVLARRILRSMKSTNPYVLPLSAIFYVFVIFGGLQNNYVGRGTLGEVLLAFFLFSTLMVLNEGFDREKKRAWLVVLILLAVVTSYVYYTATLTIIVLMVLLVAVQFVVPPSRKKQLEGPWLVIGVIAIFLFVRNPFFYSLGSGINPELLIVNFFEYMKFMLRIERQESVLGLLYVGAVEVDTLTNILKWIGFAVRLASMVAVVIVLYAFRPRKGKSVPQFAWLFSLVIFFSAPAEFAYLFIGPFFPFRHLIRYGLLVLLLIALYLLNAQKEAFRFLRFRSKLNIAKLAGLSLTATILLASLGFLRTSWYYGAAKPFGYYEVQPVSEFLSTYRTKKNPIILTGDAYYTSCIFFATSLYNKSDAVIPEPLGEDSLVLHYALQAGKLQDFFARLSERKIGYVLIVRTTKPIFGDEWGYPVTFHNSSVLEGSSLNIVYNDGKSELFGEIHR